MFSGLGLGPITCKIIDFVQLIISYPKKKCVFNEVINISNFLFFLISRIVLKYIILRKFLESMVPPPYENILGIAMNVTSTIAAEIYQYKFFTLKLCFMKMSVLFQMLFILFSWTNSILISSILKLWFLPDKYYT